MVKTRVAPSPTGNGIVHIGTLRQMYHNWLFARANNGKFVFRIDDTDLERSVPKIIDKLYEALEWLGLDYDETFKQSDRFGRYLEVAEQLVDKGLAIRDDGCIRMAGEDFDCSWVDEISGDKPDNDQIKEFSKNQVIIKSDQSPVYNFCTTVDDIDSEITDIIRGVDHIPNTYKQAYLYRALEQAMPKFHHVGLICHTTGKKLSKRDSDAIDITQYDRDAVLNYILRLAWSPYEDNKTNNIIKKDRAIELFVEEGSFKASNAKVDFNKLNFYNKVYSKMNRNQLRSEKTMTNG